jgi:hypothetical protein
MTTKRDLQQGMVRHMELINQMNVVHAMYEKTNNCAKDCAYHWIAFSDQRDDSKRALEALVKAYAFDHLPVFRGDETTFLRVFCTAMNRATRTTNPYLFADIVEETVALFKWEYPRGTQ